MTTNNINKFVRGSINLKPWTLSKNSADIVNSYVKWLYKQAPHHFKNDMEWPRSAIYNLESQCRTPMHSAVRHTLPIGNKPKSKLCSSAYRSPPVTAKNSFVFTPLKKFAKSPNLKIYNTRRFASSASSSNASFFRYNCEERRKRMYKPANGMQFRKFTGSAAMPAGNFYNNPGVAKYIAPTRLYNELSNKLKTNTIQKNLMLMPVDKDVKQKIRFVPDRTKATPPEPVDMTKRDTLVVSFKGWLPSVIHVSKFTALPVIRMPPSAKKCLTEKGPPSFGSTSVRQRAHGSKVSPLDVRANARHQVSTISPHAGVSTRSYFLRSTEKTMKSCVDPITFEECVPLVCRSRGGAHSVRSNSQRNLSKARKY